MPRWNITDVDQALHIAAKKAALDRGVTLKRFVLDAVAVALHAGAKIEILEPARLSDETHSKNCRIYGCGLCRLHGVVDKNRGLL